MDLSALTVPASLADALADLPEGMRPDDPTIPRQAFLTRVGIYKTRAQGASNAGDPLLYNAAMLMVAATAIAAIAHAEREQAERDAAAGDAAPGTA